MSSWSVTTSLRPASGFVADGKSSYMAGGTLVKPNAGAVWNDSTGWTMNAQPVQTSSVSSPQTSTASSASSSVSLSDLVNTADPFAKYRSGYGAELKSLTDDPSKIANTGAYKWAFDQGMEAVNRTAAAKGQLGSGNRLADLMKYGQGMASQQFNTVADLYSALSGAKQAPSAGMAAGASAYNAINNANYQNGMLGVAQQNAANNTNESNLQTQYNQIQLNQLRDALNQQKDIYAGWGVY